MRDGPVSSALIRHRSGVTGREQMRVAGLAETNATPRGTPPADGAPPI
jgi:hypothetical protein